MEGWRRKRDRCIIPRDFNNEGRLCPTEVALMVH
jgi:hypothetical protein